VKPGGPEFRIIIRPLPFVASPAPVHAGDIEVARCEDRTLLQVLPMIGESLPDINVAATFSLLTSISTGISIFQSWSNSA
jgi:hypothetical protein